MRHLQIGDDDFGVIRAKKIVDESRIWLTSKPEAVESASVTIVAWWVVVEGPDQKIRTVGFVRPPQEQRARETYEAMSKPHVLAALLEGRDS